ncbi:MAG: ABC transporter permease [Alphaproteobacteria bacterium]|nr:ABC transporter permease [Alphaproteobacteria bacterium]
MIWWDRWQEVFETHARNRLRSGITAASVAWGIFMLVVLLGAGTGLENNVAWGFRDDAVNSIWIYGGKTSLPWKGHPVGRSVGFTNRDFALIRDTVPGVEYITGRFYLWGEFAIRWRDKAGAFSVRSCHPDHLYLERTKMVAGRFLNPIDIEQKRKVTVIGVEVADFLFGDHDPLGETLDIRGIAYQVVGVYEDEGGGGELRQVYIPISTAQAAYGGGERVHQIMFTVGDASVEASEEIAERVTALLAERHHFDPADPRAIRIRNNLESFAEIQQIFTWIRAFIWVVGIGTVLAGVVGVSNIMLISVRERTRELGLRKALGAPPGALVAMILREAVALTAVSGYVGLVAGVAVIELVRQTVPENDYVRDPEVQLSAAVGALVLLVVCGALAGWFPARRAAQVHPIEALRTE